MKHLIYSIFCLTLAGILTGCYSDQGNYTYKDIDSVEVKVSGIESSYVVRTFEVLNITPTITPNNEEYECYWGVYPSTETSINKMSIISKDKNLSYAVTLKPGSYKLRYSAKNKKTGVLSYTEYDLTVETDIVKGWWVLKEKNGNTDIDIHTSLHSFSDRIATTSGQPLAGTPKNFLYAGNWQRLDSIGEGSEKRYTSVVTPCVFVASDKDLKVLDYYTTETIGTFESLFKMNYPAIKKPEDIFFASYYISLLNDGKIYSIRTVGNSATSFFSDPLLGTYKLSPNKAVSYYWQPLMYDETSSSFCTYSTIDNYIQFYKDLPSFKLNYLDADLLFFNHRKMVNSPEWAFALLKSKTSKEYYMYKFNSLPGRKKPVVIQVDTLKEDKRMFHAERYAYTKSYNQVFFTSGNDIWSCDFADYSEKKQISVPQGESITLIETLVPEVAAGTVAPVYFVLATQIGDKYKLYIYNIQAGNIADLVSIYEGTGKVKRAMLLNLENNKVWQTYLD